MKIWFHLPGSDGLWRSLTLSYITKLQSSQRTGWQIKDKSSKQYRGLVIIRNMMKYKKMVQAFMEKGGITQLKKILEVCQNETVKKTAAQALELAKNCNLHI